MSGRWPPPCGILPSRDTPPRDRRFRPCRRVGPLQRPRSLLPLESGGKRCVPHGFASPVSGAEGALDCDVVIAEGVGDVVEGAGLFEGEAGREGTEPGGVCERDTAGEFGIGVIEWSGEV